MITNHEEIEIGTGISLIVSPVKNSTMISGQSNLKLPSTTWITTHLTHSISYSFKLSTKLLDT